MTPSVIPRHQDPEGLCLESAVSCNFIWETQKVRFRSPVTSPYLHNPAPHPCSATTEITTPGRVGVAQRALITSYSLMGPSEEWFWFPWQQAGSSKREVASRASSPSHKYFWKPVSPQLNPRAREMPSITWVRGLDVSTSYVKSSHSRPGG